MKRLAGLATLLFALGPVASAGPRTERVHLPQSFIEADTWFITAVWDGINWDAAVGRVQPSGLDLEILSVLDLPVGTGLGLIALVPEALTQGVHELRLYVSTTADESMFPVVSGPDVAANGEKDTVLLRLQIAADPWVDLGCALAGTHGAPTLQGTGTLGLLSPCSVTLQNALASAPAWMIVGFAGLNIHLQQWIQDPAGPAGFSASNGLRGTTP